MPGGLIYAPEAALAISGNGQFKGSIIAGTMNISGNTIFNQVASDRARPFTRPPRSARPTASTTSPWTARARPSPSWMPTTIRTSTRRWTRSTASSARPTAGPTPVRSIRPGLDVPDRAQSARPDQRFADRRSDRRGRRQLGNGGSPRRGMGARHRPGAQIILVEANSQSLADLMTGVADRRAASRACRWCR